MTRPLLALTLTALLAAPAAAQGAAPGATPPPPRDGFLALTDLGAGPRARGSDRERLELLGKGLLRLLPGAKGLVPRTTGRFRLAVLLVAFADVKRAEWGPEAWDAALFSRGTYRATPSGQLAFGSMADWFDENSGGALRLEGKVFDWVAVRHERAALEPRPLVDPTARAFFGEALDALLKREGAAALEGFDALAFVVAGKQAGRRGSVLWPHSTALLHGGRAWRYYLMHAEEEDHGFFEPVGVHCHEMGHVLGLLDKYGVGRHTGLGQWCAMANGAHGGRARGLDAAAPARGFDATARDLLDETVASAREWLEELTRPRPRPEEPRPRDGASKPDDLDEVEKERRRLEKERRRAEALKRVPGEARPLHLCAVCKARLGWTRPVVIDPRQPRRVYLTAVEQDARQVARVLLDDAGRETLVLEHRGQVGFDAGLPRGGLLVWRTGDPGAMLRTFVPFEDVELVPAHGVRSTDAALRDPALVPFPTPRRDDLVVAGRGPGALAVRLSGIQVDGAGRLYVEVGLAR